MGRQLFRLLLFGVVAFVAVHACRDWQEKRRQAARPAARPAGAAAATGVEATDYASDKTRRMEEEARAIDQRFAEIRASNMSEAERERAIAELLDRQRRLMAEGEGASPPAPR